MAKKQAATKIIAGKFKGTKLPFKPNKELRPTENKTKETLFNWLLNDLEGKVCLDMFAGTGSLGLEAISRGAKYVFFIEKDKRLSTLIESNIKKLNIEDRCKVINSNSISLDYGFIEDKFDLIFLDPPFHENLVTKAIQLISTKKLLSKNGLIYIECEKNLAVDSRINEYKKIKSSKGGEVKFYLYES